MISKQRPLCLRRDMRIRRRLEQIEGLEEKEKRQVIQLLDTFIEKNRLKQQAMGG